MSLSEKIKNTFPKSIKCSDELALLFDWIEQQARIDYFLSDFVLADNGNDALKLYFDNYERYINNLALFAHTGNGGLVGIWKNGDVQKYIHLGSEGNEWYILADTTIDFLKLLAIGYPDIVGGDWAEKPEHKLLGEKQFIEWIKENFNETVPQNASGIADKKDRSFAQWIYEKSGSAETFDEFDPDNENYKSFYGKVKVEVVNIPDSKKEFLFDLRKITSLSISELMALFKNTPFIVFEDMCIIRSGLSIKNLPENLAVNLLILKDKYPENIKVYFKEKSIADCDENENYNKLAKRMFSKSSKEIELK